MHRQLLVSRRLGAVAVAVAVLIGAAACDGGQPADRQGAGPAGDADLRYGQAPRPHPDVTYQPDVVIVEGGGGSVRSVTADGLTWRVDPRARRAEELSPGKVMFITGRGVGRVLDVRREGEDLAVTIGPVDITEVIRDGRFATDKRISFDRMVAYPAGEPFWADTDGGPAAGAGGGAAGGGGGGAAGGGGAGAGTNVVPAGYPAARQTMALTAPRMEPAGPPPNRPAQPPPQVGGQSRARAGGFSLTTTCCSSGVGAHFTYDSGGVRLAGSIELLLNKPSGRFDLDIRGGSIRTAKFQIEGGAGLRLKIEAASAVGAGHNINRRVEIPVDFSVPLGAFLGVPFSATVNQSLVIQTAFSAKNGNIKAAAEYSFTGSIGFGYAKGSFGTHAPTGFQVRNSLTNSISGVSIGVNGIIVAYQARFHVGIGAFGFTTGLYVGLTASVGATLGSAAGAPLALCRSAHLNLFGDYGVGYSIPAPVVDVINLFLKAFDARPIADKGGIGTSVNVLNKQEIVPDVPLCRA